MVITSNNIMYVYISFRSIKSTIFNTINIIKFNNTVDIEIF